VVTFEGAPPRPRLHFSAEAAVAHDPDRSPAAVFPVAVCRTCGQHYFTAMLHDFRVERDAPIGGEAIGETVVWRPVEDETATRLRFTDRLLTDAEDDNAAEAATAGARRVPLWLCRYCGAFHKSAVSRCSNPPCQRSEPP